MKKQVKIFKILIILSIIILCISLTTKELQNDTFYSIKIGESISKYGIDMLDHFSIHDLAYPYPHWLYDLFIYKIYNIFNLKGIYISNILLYITLIISIFHINIKLNKKEVEYPYNYIVPALISIISIYMLTTYITARAQLPSIILFLYEVYFIEMLIKTGNKKYCLYLPIISLLIANIHCAVWPMYIIIYLPYLVENLIIYIKNKKLKLTLNSYNNKIEINQNNNIKLLIISLIIGIIMAFITPIKDMPFTYAIRTMIGISAKYISEHQPLVLIHNIDLFILIIVYLGILIFTRTKIKLHDLFMLSGLIIMIFISERHIIFISTIGSIAVTRTISNFFKYEKDKSIKQIFNIITKIPITIIILIIISIYGYTNYQRNNINFINQKKYPVKASNYIIENLDLNNIRLYNHYNYGSYLIYRNIPVFIDSRADLYLKEFNKNTRVFEDTIKIENNYKTIFDKYNITHILINRKNTLNIILKNDNNYKSIYYDKYFIIYEKIN